MEILFVTNSKQLFPHGDATSAVVKNLAEELCYRGNNVTVLSLSAYGDGSKIDKLGQIKVINCHSCGCMSIEQVKRELKRSPHKGLKILIKLLVSKIQMEIVPTYRRLSLFPLALKEYKCALTRVFKQNRYDCCVVTLLPIVAVYSVQQLCPKETKICIYQLDPYWNFRGFPSRYENFRLQYEKELASKCFIMLTTPQIYRINNRKCEGFFEHLIPVGFPMVKKCVYDAIGFGDGLVHCVFIGTLYRDIRPPELAIKIFSKTKNKKVVFDFYGTGQELIRNMPEYQTAENIILHGSVSSKEADKIRANADYLINIDNTVTNMVPSKIFEYISTGKPIINCYFKKQSSLLEYLEEYPSHISLLLDSTIEGDNVASLEEYLSIPHENIPYSQIEDIYYEHTPKYVAKMFLDAIMERDFSSET